MPNKKISKLKKTAIVILLLLLAFFAYVEIVNRNSINMTYRQKFLKAVYPAWMWFTKITGKNTKTVTNKEAVPPVSFYSLQAYQNNTVPLDFASLKGKKVLLVNTASDCGYTDQYADLEKLSNEYKDKLVVIGFPANDFKEQEKGSDEAIAAFCKTNYGVSFPLMKKSVVVKSTEQNTVYQWLTDPAKNGWNDMAPSWNFCKYLVDENGKLVSFYASSIEPFNKEIIDAINK